MNTEYIKEALDRVYDLIDMKDENYDPLKFDPFINGHETRWEKVCANLLQVVQWQQQDLEYLEQKQKDDLNKAVVKMLKNEQ